MIQKNDPQPPALRTPGDPCSAAAVERDCNVLRCACGSMLARYVEGRIELKCRRCKRTLIVPVSGAWEEDHN
jgi:hypothetical protein